MRVNFTRKVQGEIWLNACDEEGRPRCETKHGFGCGAILKKGEGQCDHIDPDAMHDYDPNRTWTAKDGQLLCKICHREKSKDDNRTIKKNNRIRDKARGTYGESKQVLPGTIRSGLRKELGTGHVYDRATGERIWPK